MILIKYHRASDQPFTMNFSTTNADFKTLKNGVDERIAFIQHIETGYYNISKARNVVHAIKTAENEAVGYPTASLKVMTDWFKNDSTQEIIAEVKTQTGLNNVHYALETGTPKQFAGTYVHELLVDHFLTWLDPKYAIIFLSYL